jgi:hypothetical protein
MNDGTHRLDAYLGELRSGLKPLPQAERDDIVAELRSHVIDSTGDLSSESAVRAALERLGTAEQLAAQYVTRSVLTGVERSRSPWALVKGLARVAGGSIAGLSALTGLALGYGLATSFTLAALRKPLAPDRVGLWRLAPDSFSLTLGFGGRPSGEELLGWWIVPIGLLAGAGVLWITTRFGCWCAGRLRRSPLAAAR